MSSQQYVCFPSPRIIRFRIVEYDAETGVAIVKVESKPLDGRVPDAFLPPEGEDPETEGLLVEVIDAAGCFLNEPSPALTGRYGFAVFLDPSLTEDPYDPPRWEIFSLCCPSAVCEEV